MFTLYLFLATTRSTNQWAHKLIDGVEIEVDEETAIIQGEPTTYITITKPEYPIALLQNIKAGIKILEADTSTPWSVIAVSRLHVAEQFITTPVSWWTPPRTRRGVVNGVGHAMRFLFGTATDSELKEVKLVLEEMQRNQDTTLLWIDQFTIAINHTYEEAQINRNHINLLIKEVQGISSELQNGLSGVLRQIRMVRNQQAVSEIVTQMVIAAQQYT